LRLDRRPGRYGKGRKPVLIDESAGRSSAFVLGAMVVMWPE
jgi:hypothetical protein